MGCWDGRITPTAIIASICNPRKNWSIFTLNAMPVRWDILLPGRASIALDEAYLDVQKVPERIAYDLAAGRELLTPPYAEPEYRRRMYGRPAAPANQ
jgi:hypothetical protein